MRFCIIINRETAYLGTELSGANYLSTISLDSKCIREDPRCPCHCHDLLPFIAGVIRLIRQEPRATVSRLGGSYPPPTSLLKVRLHIAQSKCLCSKKVAINSDIPLIVRDISRLRALAETDAPRPPDLNRCSHAATLQECSPNRSFRSVQTAVSVPPLASDEPRRPYFGRLGLPSKPWYGNTYIGVCLK